MREILFRGKSIYNRWAYGHFLCYDNNVKAYIVEDFDEKEMYLVEVTLETVGQYTGLTDKNGVKIFEGDALKTPYGIGFVDYADGAYYVALVRDIDPLFAGDCKGALLYLLFDEENHLCAEVIGNIHDDPELLEEE